MGYKYKMGDLDCNHCAEKGNPDCLFRLCPYIMGNLSELFAGIKFREAVKDAENCKTRHRNTLVYLKEQGIKRSYDLFVEETVFRRNCKPECEDCTYASPGFVCYSKKDGTCLRDWIRSKRHAEIC